MNKTNKYVNYSFEKASSNRLSNANLEADRNAFLKNIGLNDDQISKVKNIIIDQFIIHHSSNIEWYQDKQKTENRRRKLYNVISIALLLLIPLATFGITNYFASKDTNLELVSSLIAALLTSLFALHKTISSWLEKRKLNSLFHSAGSRLKSQLYAVEDKWSDGSAIIAADNHSIEFSQAFLDDLASATFQTRTIIDEERMAYYELISFPKIELASLLTTSQQEAVSLMKNFQSKAFSRTLSGQQAAASKADELAAWEIDLKNLEVKRDLLEKELAILQERWAQATGDKKKQLAKQIIEIEAMIEKYLYDHIKGKIN